MGHRLRVARSFTREIVMIGLAVAFLFPLYMLVTIALKRPADVARSPLAPPVPPRFDNFEKAWTQGHLGQALLSSTIVTVASVLLLVLVGSAAAYGLVRGAGSRFRAITLMAIILGITIPGQLGMVPLYQLLRDVGMLGSYWALILFNTGSLLPITIFLYAGFIRTQSSAYEEAASIDGASSFQTFRSIVFPLLRPITGTVIVINAIGIWNEFLPSLLFLGGDVSRRTLPVAVYAFRGEYTTDWGLIFSGMVIALIPMVAVYFALQKYIIKGFAGGLKG